MDFLDPIFLLLAITGITFSLMGFLMLKYPPTYPNALYGYRTPNSMKSKERWDFAQQYSGKLSVWYGAFLLIVGIVALFMDVPLEYGIGISLAIILAVAALLLVQTENAINRNFKDET